MLLLFSTGVANCLKKSCLFLGLPRPLFVTKASHTVIVDFGCSQHKQPGEGWAPLGLTLP